VLRGNPPSADLLRAAGDAAAAQSEPLADVDGDEAYKRTVIGVYTRRALEKALA
jgi:aerobic carbon-monoxide dehydrogenase medium subunit